MSRGNNDILRGLKDVEYYAAQGGRGEYAITGGYNILFRLYGLWNRSHVTNPRDVRKLTRIPDLYVVLTSGVQ